MLRKSLIILLTLLMLPVCASAKKPRRSSDAMKEKKRTEQQITRTAKDLEAAEAELARNLRKVTELEAAIDESRARVSSLNARMDSIAQASAAVEDSIAVNEAELARLRELYVKAVRSSRKHRRELNAVTFIFSASTFRQAMRRMHYLEEFSAWRARKASQITEINTRLDEQRQQLELMKRQTATLQSQALAEHRKLAADREALKTAVGSLQGKQKQLNNMLRKQQNTLTQLDREIDKLIQQEAEEQRRREEAERKRKAEEERKRKAAEEAARKKGGDAPGKQTSKPEEQPTKPGKKEEFKPEKQAPAPATGTDFAAQKGKLPSPLSHTYVIAQGFGVQAHRSVKTLQVNNSGIDLETAKGATARAVHPGEVTGVFVQSGLHYVVLLRHGQYITVYANLDSISVVKGAKLKAGDVIGTVAASPVNPDRGQLHFEIRREREKFNPAQWLRH